MFLIIGISTRIAPSLTTNSGFSVIFDKILNPIVSINAIPFGDLKYFHAPLSLTNAIKTPKPPADKMKFFKLAQSLMIPTQLSQLVGSATTSTTSSAYTPLKLNSAITDITNIKPNFFIMPPLSFYLV